MIFDKPIWFDTNEPHPLTRRVMASLVLRKTYDAVKSWDGPASDDAEDIEARERAIKRFDLARAEMAAAIAEEVTCSVSNSPFSPFSLARAFSSPSDMRSSERLKIPATRKGKRRSVQPSPLPSRR